MKVKVVRLSSDPNSADDNERGDGVKTQPPRETTAWIIDEAVSEDYLEMVDDFRRSLPLDAKRPTVKRRFFSSSSCPAIREGLVKAIKAAVEAGTSSDGIPEKELGTPDNNNNKPGSHPPPAVHVLAYMRFLEYDEVGGRLDPHTDGNKVCEDTGQRSTHTLLLYLRDCHRGGETVLLEENKKRVVVEAVRPIKGRILLFPHPTRHEGAPTVDVPKLCLRAEVCLG